MIMYGWYLGILFSGTIGAFSIKLDTNLFFILWWNLCKQMTIPPWSGDNGNNFDFNDTCTKVKFVYC